MSSAQVSHIVPLADENALPEATMNPAIIAARIIGSPKMQSQCTLDNPKNPKGNVAANFRKSVEGLLEESGKNWKDTLAENPAELQVMRQFIDLERGAVKSRFIPVPQDLKETDEALDVIATELASIVPQSELPKIKDLPPDYQNLLKVEKSHTAQSNFRPISGPANAVLGWTKYLGREAKEHLWPDTWKARAGVAAGLGAVGLATVLVTSNIGTGSHKISEEDAIVTVCSIEDTLAGRQGDACQSTATLDMSEVAEKSCVSHVKAFTFGNETAANVLTYVGAHKLLGADCYKKDTLASDAKGALLAGYDANLNRHKQTLGNPAVTALSYIPEIGVGSAEDPELARQVYNESLQSTVDSTVEGINKYDVYENLILHGGIWGGFLFGFGYAAARGRRPSLDGVKRAAVATKDYLWKHGQKNPVTMTATFMGGAYPSFNEYFWKGDLWTGNMNPDVVLGAIFAGVAGHMVTKAGRYMNRRQHTREMIVDVQDQLSALTQAHVIGANNDKPPKITHKDSLARLTLPPAFAAAATYTLINLDFMFNNGQLTAQTVGVGVPVSMFLASNPVTDVIAHKGFALAGAAKGLIGGAALRGAYVGAQTLRGKEVQFFHAVEEVQAGCSHEGCDGHHHNHNQHLDGPSHH